MLSILEARWRAFHEMKSESFFNDIEGEKYSWSEAVSMIADEKVMIIILF